MDLKKLEEIRKNKFKFNKKYEDIHLNVEKRLFEIIGKCWLFAYS